MPVKIKFALITFVGSLLSRDFVAANENVKAQLNTKFITVLKDKKGVELGKVYVEDFKNDIFKKLLITKINHGKIDTLYFINNWLFTNPKGTDITFSKQNFNGYKIEHIKNDSIQIFGIGGKSTGASDPVIIEWNYRKSMFEVDQSAE